MKTTIAFQDIIIRTEVHPGDLGYVIFMHGKIYKKECNYGLAFESYVAKGMSEFMESLDKSRSTGWICERSGTIVGFLALVDRGDLAQLRYFILDPSTRGLGLGKKLMNLFMDYLKDNDFKGAYLLTTHEQPTAAHLYEQHGFRLVNETPVFEPFGKHVRELRFEFHFDEGHPRHS